MPRQMPEKRTCPVKPRLMVTLGVWCHRDEMYHITEIRCIMLQRLGVSFTHIHGESMYQKQAKQLVMDFESKGLLQRDRFMYFWTSSLRYHNNNLKLGIGASLVYCSSETEDGFIVLKLEFFSSFSETEILCIVVKLELDFWIWHHLLINDLYMLT